MGALGQGRQAEAKGHRKVEEPDIGSVLDDEIPFSAMDARDITKALGGKWAGRYGLARCPVHDDRTPSLKVRDDPRKDDGIDVVCFANCDWRDVKAALVRQGLLPEFKPTSFSTSFSFTTPPPAPDRADEAGRVDLALKIWDAAGPLKNSLGWRYFTERRGLRVGLLDLDHCLRFHVGFSAVVASDDGRRSPIEPAGVHRTFLKADATKNAEQGREGQDDAGQGRAPSACRADEDRDATAWAFAEGIEDRASPSCSPAGRPVWVCGFRAGGIERLPVMAGIEHLTIFADNDRAGIHAAQTCADRWHQAGRDAEVRTP